MTGIWGRKRRALTWLACVAGLSAASLALPACAPAGTAASAASHRKSPAPPSFAPPAPLKPFRVVPGDSQGSWQAAGRPVSTHPAVYETTLIPPGGSQPAGIAWLDQRLLSARLYSGWLSPGPGKYRFKTPIQPAQARTLVAIFNGGFKLRDTRGGYLTEGHLYAPLRTGAASLVIYADGSVGLGAWGRDVRMTSKVISVRQNLELLVDAGRPTPAALGRWKAWGSTCGADSCAKGVPGVEHVWRSGLGITATGALVFTCGPEQSPAQLAAVLVRAGAIRAMELDINYNWPVLVTYDPPAPDGLAAPSNGSKLLPATTQGPATFFTKGWSRDFITLSARPVPAAG